MLLDFMEGSRRQALIRALTRVPSAFWVACVLLTSATLWLDAHRRYAWDLRVLDAMEYGDVARHLANGQGFTTSLIYPAELEFGVSHAHPSLVRPPVWPLLLAGGFALFGVHDWVAHALLGAVQLATLAAAMALAWSLAGRAAGLTAGLAIGASPQILSASMLAGADPALGLWFTLAWLGFARRLEPFWIGALCGLAYLTRYNGVALIGAVAFALLARDGHAALRGVIRCGLGFVLVSLPWWVRNALVAGDPFFSLYRWGVYFSPIGGVGNTKTLLNMIEPDASSPFAMHPIAKLRLTLPMILLQWPPASANLSACVALLLACWRRDRVAWGILLLAVATTGIVAIALPRGRYFVPLLPVLLAVGASFWLRYGGRARWIGLALVLLAPILPSWPEEASDLAIYRAVLRGALPLPPRGEPESWGTCLRPEDLVVADDASRVVWDSGAVTIWLAASEDDFWTIVDRYPVEFVFLGGRKDLLTPRFARSFEPRPDCAKAFYQRRDRAIPR